MRNDAIDHSLHFFFNDTATTEIYTLSLHDALPILLVRGASHSTGTADPSLGARDDNCAVRRDIRLLSDRKSTRLNSSHSQISYAVFCLKKKTGGMGSRDAATAAGSGGSRGTSATGP